ncbi:CoA transferase [Microbispora oryzae]|uniref:CoA transferase n=1 Tax=Microbispora oryzae TaxID=2806554 RepID=UPI001AEBB9F2|nr:CoA transferase [Microbispora oryzae]
MIQTLIKELAESAGVEVPDVHVTGGDPVLPSVYRLGTLAAVSVGAVTAAVAAYGAAAGRLPPADTAAREDGEAPPPGPLGDAPGPAAAVSVDVRHAAVAFQSERHFRIHGEPLVLWAPLSGDYPTADGWVRLHCNFDHHREAVLRALGLPQDAGCDDLAQACASRTAVEIEEAVTREDGCAAAMRGRAEWRAHPHYEAVAASPLVALRRIASPTHGSRTDQAHLARPAAGDLARLVEADPLTVDPLTGDRRSLIAAGRPLSGVRVLDLTRVIAGPVAARTLAAHGADVLRVGAAHVPEVPGLVVETAFGKRSCHIDLRKEPDALRRLIRTADVVIQAYRPGALSGRGLGPSDMAELNPDIVCVDISAYGSHGPWGGRRGFDSLVQMVTGIAHENAAAVGPAASPGLPARGAPVLRPIPLPAQALDHATGYLAAFGAVAALLRRRAEGGPWRIEVSLARTAAWLDDLGRADGRGVAEPSADGLLATMDSAFGRLTYVTPPGMIRGARPYWAGPPPRPGEHPPDW